MISTLCLLRVELCLFHSSSLTKLNACSSSRLSHRDSVRDRDTVSVPRDAEVTKKRRRRERRRRLSSSLERKNEKKKKKKIDDDEFWISGTFFQKSKKEKKKEPKSSQKKRGRGQGTRGGGALSGVFKKK